MLHCMKTHLLTVQSRGTVALPADLRRRLHLDQPNAQVKLVEHEDGRVELVPVVAVPADQAWFWSERWQQMEREADADIAAGRTTTVDGLDGLLEHLSTVPPVKFRTTRSFDGDFGRLSDGSSSSSVTRSRTSFPPATGTRRTQPPSGPRRSGSGTSRARRASGR